MAAQTVYIDPTVAASGSGTEASPYKDFTEAKTWTSPSEDGSTIYVKRGTILYDDFDGMSLDNLTITAYGAGARPIIDGSDPYTDSWTLEGEFWYTPMVTGYAVSVNDRFTWNVQNKADLAAEINGYTNWHDTSNNRLYIYLDDNVNPNNAAVRIAARDSFLDGTFDGLRVEGLHLRRYRHFAIEGTGVDFTSCEIIDNEIGELSFNIGTGTMCLHITGLTALTKATGLKIIGNRLYNCRGINTSHGVEIGYIDGGIIADNDIEHCSTQGVELWQECSNCIVERNRLTGYARGFWITDGNSGGHDHTGNIYRNNLLIGVINTWNDNGSAASGGRCVDVEVGTGNLFYNNTFYAPDNLILKQTNHATVGSNTLTFKNNVCVEGHEDGLNGGGFMNCDDAITSDHNAYYILAGSWQFWRINGTSYANNFAGFQAVSDANSINSDPGLIGYTNFDDMIPSSVSAGAVGAADFNIGVDTNIPTTDFTRELRYPYTANETDCGAYQFERIGKKEVIMRLF